MLQHAAITDAARVGQQLRPGVGMRGEKAVNQALDPFWIRAVPMPKAMQRAFSAGKRFEIENCGHHMQGCAMKGVAVFQAGTAVSSRCDKWGELRGRNSLRNSDSHACTQDSAVWCVVGRVPMWTFRRVVKNEIHPVCET